MDDSTFYATIAQVLPLFVLALALERRTFGAHEKSAEPTLDALLGISIITTAAIGEFACFSALAGTPSHSTRTTAEVALGLTGVFLLGDLVWSQVSAHAEHNTPKWQRRLIIGFGGLVIAAAAVFLTVFALAAGLD